MEDTLFQYLFVIFYMKDLLSIFAFILTLSNITPQETQTTLAVLDFEGRGINTLEAATLTDRFTSEIGKTEAMVLVDRTMVEEILKEQGFQQSGCTTDECAVISGTIPGFFKDSWGWDGLFIFLAASVLNAGVLMIPKWNALPESAGA